MSKTVTPASLTGKRFVVWGDNAIARATKSSLMQAMGHVKLDFFSTEALARERLWEAGDSPALSDSTHLIYVASTALMPDQLFRTHCRFRPNDSQHATLDRRGPGWSGGIVFVGPVAGNLEELTKIEPFSRITVGHAVMPLPYLLKDLLIKMAQMQPIYPDAWKDSLMALEGLAKLKSVLANIEDTETDSADHLQSLNDALVRLLEDRLLDRLLAHREVVGELRVVLASSRRAIEDRNPDGPRDLVNRIRHILEDYL